MTLPARDPVGSVVTLWRYPVKSMLGEELNASNVTERGLLGDRGYALVDGADGKIASAKNPRKWPRMFEFRAALGADGGELRLRDVDLVEQLIEAVAELIFTRAGSGFLGHGRHGATARAIHLLPHHYSTEAYGFSR